MDFVNTIKTKRFETALDEIIGQLQALRYIPDGWKGGKQLETETETETEIDSIEYIMKYLPEIFREGDND